MRLSESACCELSAAHSAQQIKRVDAFKLDVEEVRTSRIESESAREREMACELHRFVVELAADADDSVTSSCSLTRTGPTAAQPTAHPAALSLSKTKRKQVDDLSSLTSLIRLDLSDNPRLRSLEPVLRSTSGSLKHVVAARCTGLSSPSSSALLLPRGLSLPRLRVIDLTSCGLATFDATAAPKLAALILTGNPGITISGLAGCAELATLVVKGCELTDESLSLALRGAASLSKLSAAGNRLEGGERLDLSALRGTLSELRLGRNALAALPRGLSPRLRLLDAGGNAGLGPLRSVVAELSRVSAGAGGGSGSWLRSVTLRGTAAALEEGYEAAVAAAAPSLRVLDDKRVASRDDKTPAAVAEQEEEGGGGGGREVGVGKERRRQRPSAGAGAVAVAVGKLAGETGLSLPRPPPLPEGPRTSVDLPLPPPRPPPPPPPPPPATPEAEAAARKSGEKPGGGSGARVIEVRKKKARKGQGAGSSENEAGGGGGVATGKEAARLLAAAAAGAGECILEEVGGW